MSRLNGKRRRALAQVKARHALAQGLNPTTQPEAGNARSVWNDPAKVHRMKEMRFRPVKPVNYDAQGVSLKARKRPKRWADS